MKKAVINTGRQNIEIQNTEYRKPSHQDGTSHNVYLFRSWVHILHRTKLQELDQQLQKPSLLYETQSSRSLTGGRSLLQQKEQRVKRQDKLTATGAVPPAQQMLELHLVATWLSLSNLNQSWVLGLYPVIMWSAGIFQTLGCKSPQEPCLTCKVRAHWKQQLPSLPHEGGLTSIQGPYRCP